MITELDYALSGHFKGSFEAKNSNMTLKSTMKDSISTELSQQVFRVFQWAEQRNKLSLISPILNFGYVSVRRHICKFMCESGIWANIAAQIASEAPKIRANRLACKSKHPTYLI